MHNSLYDQNDSNSLAVAAGIRDQFTSDHPTWIASSVIFSFDAFGNLEATVEITSDPNDLAQTRTIQFRWVDVTFKRVN